jgi:Rad3-related DNA helicase
MKALPAPNILGLPNKYTKWRAHQSKAVSKILSSKEQFVTQIAPTGFGKSLAYVSAAHIGTNRTVILTSTKALQRQLMDDFSEIGLVSVKGKNAYMCKWENDGSTCEEGPCNAGIKCRLKEEGGCTYYDALKSAQTSPLLVTNYAMWMTYNKFAKGFAQPDLLVCDEAHDLPQTVSSFLTSKISRTNPMIWNILVPPDSWYQSIEKYAKWADAMRTPINNRLRDLRSAVKKEEGGKRTRRELKAFKNLYKSITTMSRMNEGDWVMDINDKYIEFAPIWPKRYTQGVLFLDIDKVLLTSATVCDKTTQMLGVSTHLNDIMEFPHSFPKANRMLIHIPTVRMNIHATNLDIREWTKRIDQILRTRLDRKGIIHTVSYERRNHVLSQSKYSECMMTHQTKDAVKMVQRFKRANPPKVLVSPSMTTGWDFPYDQCEYQIIGKLAYPDTRNKIVKARVEEDGSYGAYIAMQQLVQACGRAVRAKDDHSENFIIDDNIRWFVKKFSSFAPRWFLEAYRSTRTIPAPPPLLRKK